MDDKIHRYVFAPVEAVIHGHRALDELSGELERLGARRVLVITSPSVRRLPVFALVATALGDRCAEVFDESVPHLPVEMADRLIAVSRALQPDAVVSLGGGTVSDAGKAVVAALTIDARSAAGLHPLRFVASSRGIDGGMPALATPEVPQIAIPTTLSAAEYCGAFAMTDHGVKDGYTDLRLTPRVVMLDPRAARDTPDRLWASTGMRAMDHAVESYLSRNPTPPTDATSAAAVRLLLDHLPAAVGDTGRDEARLQCLVAGWLSMFGFHNAGLGLSHAIGHQLGARWNVPHGETSCVTLPPVIRLLAQRMPARAATLARACGVAPWGPDDALAACALVDAVNDLMERLPVPRRLRDVGVPEDGLPELGAAVVGRTTSRVSALDVSSEDVVALARAMY